MKYYWVSTEETIEKETLLTINEFLQSMKLENKAEATINKYRRILEQFFRECPIALEDITSDDVLQWFTNFSKDKAARTLDLYLAALSMFFQFCIEEDYIHETVVKKRWRSKIPYSMPRYLNEQELAKVKLEAETLPVRDRALILFLFSSGCRSHEVANLKVQDVELKKREAIVNGKGGKIRYVHFSEECALILSDYLTTRRPEPEEPLFMNKFGGPLQKTGIYKITTSLGKKAGLRYSLHPHCCRHTFATTMLSKGADLEFIADQLGHSDLNTTRVYARIPSEDLMAHYQNKMG